MGTDEHGFKNGRTRIAPMVANVAVRLFWFALIRVSVLVVDPCPSVFIRGSTEALWLGRLGSFHLRYMAALCMMCCMIAKDLIAASSKPLVLSILAEGESYGYEIIQKVRELSGEEIEWTDGMLYPVLHRLERDDLIVAEWKQADSGRERKYYRLSSDGKKMLKAEREQWLTVHNTLCKLWKLKPVSI
jgi:PadR family transcriptional regulator PadR